MAPYQPFHPGLYYKHLKMRDVAIKIDGLISPLQLRVRWFNLHYGWLIPNSDETLTIDPSALKWWKEIKIKEKI